MVSCSDDFTMILWKSIHEKPESVRITGLIFILYFGHRLPINHVLFSPNGKYFASASFDKSIKLWDGLTGKYFNIFIRFIVSLLGHVHRVYQVNFKNLKSWHGHRIPAFYVARVPIQLLR